MNTWIGYFLAKLKGKLLGNQYHHLNKWFCKQGINFTGGGYSGTHYLLQYS